MKILVTGGAGMLARDLVPLLVAEGHDVSSPFRQDLDITDPRALDRLAKNFSFDWVINCAAYTAVDKAETEIARASQVNGIAPGGLAAVCADKGWRMIHVSTDFVFDGESARPYQEPDQASPKSVYGKTKLMGEQNAARFLPEVVIVRTSWLYGIHGKSFPRTLIGAWKEAKHLRVVADQTGCPTSTRDLSKTLADAVSLGVAGGIYHASGPDPVTWHEFARRAITLYRDRVMKSDHPVVVEPIAGKDWPAPAPRPRYSVLDNAKAQSAGLPPHRSLDESLSEFVLGMDA
jgi:dTDP-4-dehydrorhamnose reductase